MNIYKHHHKTDLNDLVTSFTDKFKELLDLYNPLVTRRLTTRRREPWF